MVRRLLLLALLVIATLRLAAQRTEALAPWDAPQWAPSPRHEVRAVWLTTLSGLDWPTRPARTAAEAHRQQDELCQILDRLQAAGINTVIFQTRLRGTTAYASQYEPWDAVFAGQVGAAPPYDPLAFAVSETHRRGMELHAWVVAFPLCTVAQERSQKALAVPRRHPELCRRGGDRWLMDPGVPATADYLADLCREIVAGYDVDGIHLDYIRYPEKDIPWDDATTYRRYGAGQRLADWRRANVTRVVRRIHEAVKSVRPWVKLSCSPVGKYADLPRQSSYGWNARDAVYQEAQEWLREGLMDLLFPMMYFDGRHFYPFACDWQEHSYGHPVVPGLGIYFLSPKEKNWSLDVITRQLQFVRQQGLGGAAYFRSRFLTDNVKGLYNFLGHTFYRRPALLPPMTWQDSIAPSVPQLAVSLNGYHYRLSWSAASDNTADVPVRYNVYRLPATASLDLDSATLIAHGLSTTDYDYAPALPLPAGTRLAVTATDAYGNESALAEDHNIWCATAAGTATITVSRHLPVSLPTGVDATTLSITDATGRCRLSAAPTDTLDISPLSSGAYTLYALTRRGVQVPVARFWKE